MGDSCHRHGSPQPAAAAGRTGTNGRKHLQHSPGRHSAGRLLPTNLDSSTKIMPLVTVGLSTHNAGDTVVAAIRSVFSQSLWDWELLIVDDGSTDSSRELLES